MRKIKLGLFLGLGFTAMIFGQEKKALHAKGNVLLAPLGMLNAGLEYQLAEKYTIQADAFVSPWRSFFGNHMQIYMGHLEGRYYFDKAFRGWYVGANAGFGLFDMSKWNYIGSEKFQRGFNYMLGATVGYQLQWKERWGIDFYLGGGTSQGFYHGYENIPPNWVRYEHASGWNKSGEWIPYRGGVMVSYKIQ
ncbi:DUF3575 domain-containing protein [Bergeyella sp. RCAD1439]|uniref:DUF3575 domain-containing protein n=1 Tax=Bergeyella anatis TaxID=3113737 RepID=UPI002E17494A|nr:DUF3575 domain-containing protein [Bergeyella sp. RCAD1439]